MIRLYKYPTYFVICVLVVLITLSIFYYINYEDIFLPKKRSFIISTETLNTKIEEEEKKSINENTMITENIYNENPNVPILELILNKYVKKQVNGTCAKFPNFDQLQFNNDNWQSLLTKNGLLYLFGAYLDARVLNNGTSIRILTMFNNTLTDNLDLYCQIWFENQTAPVISKVNEYKMIWYDVWGKDYLLVPFLMSCDVPDNQEGPKILDKLREIPKILSLVTAPCNNARNALKINHNKPASKKNFAVCVKDLNFYKTDLSVRIVEWLELMKLLGASKVYFYDHHAHPNIEKVLQHYTNEGFVENMKITLPASQPNFPLMQDRYLTTKRLAAIKHEVIPYNDCFYKHMYEYKFISLLDIDEVIVPVDGEWDQLITDKILLPYDGNISTEPISSYVARNVYFLDNFLHKHETYRDIPKYLHILQHVHRSYNFTAEGSYIKCFHDTELVLTLHNHYPMSCLGNPAKLCKSVNLDNKIIKLQHYRSNCAQELNCDYYKNVSVMDTTLWRYKSDLISKCNHVLKRLGLIV